MVTRLTEFTAAENKEVELYDLLKSLVPYITSLDGCLRCNVYQNKSDFAVIEQWQSVECHKKSVANFSKEKKQATMALLVKPPTGKYYHTE